MTHSVATPPPANSFRAWLGRVWDDPDGRSTLVGIGGVILFYLLLGVVGPRLMQVSPATLTPRPSTTARQFDIQLAPDIAPKVPERPKLPDKFVETNPDAPENVPDKTKNFGARNQQVAQEKPTPNGESDRPATEGKKDFDTTQIVSGQLTQKMENQPQVPEVPTPPQEAKVAAPKAEQNPLAGFEKKQGDSPNGFASNVGKFAENTRDIPEKVDGSKVPVADNATETMPAIDPTKPRPRQMLVSVPRVRPAILADNPIGTKNIGAASYDARWSYYGQYLQRMIDSVQIQWERYLAESKIYPASGSTVKVQFVINSEGKITSIKTVDTTATEPASRACVSAITDRSPYGEWTKDMKEMLGEEQEMTFTFYYQ